MKVLIPILFLGVGVATGYFIGVNTTKKKEQVATTNSPKLVTEVIYDTIVEKERVEVPVYIPNPDSTVSNYDSTALAITTDSTEVEVEQTDTLPESDGLVIKRERLIEAKELKINYLTITEEKDTLIKELLGINDTKAKTISVEFWESPLNFSGYKCSKNKLIVYGLSPQFSYSFHKKGELMYLAHDAVCYEMKETVEFLKLKQVNPSILDD